MTERIKTLVLEANGGTWKDVVLDTVLEGLAGYKASRELPSNLRRYRLAQRILGQRYETLSYMLDWRDALSEAPDLDIDFCNINNLIGQQKYLRGIAQSQLIIVLHSALGDYLTPLSRMIDGLNRRHGKLAIFIGNEYDLLREKIQLIQQARADYICTQLPIDTARWLYAKCTSSQILEMPHALNPRVYHPTRVPRNTDIGFIGDRYPLFIGDTERTSLIRYFQIHGAEHGLVCDIGTRRIFRSDWADFLRRTKGIVGAESGTYYLDENAQALTNAKMYLQAHPQATFQEIHEQFFARLPFFVSGKAISSRHFEPIGTKTCQILLEGRYNDILKADEHYIGVKKDLSNIQDAICRFRDEPYRSRITEHTFEYVMDQHTYSHRVKSLLHAVGY